MADDDLEANRQLFVTHIYEVMNKNRFELLPDLFHPDWQGTVPEHSEPRHGTSGFQGISTRWKAAVPDLDLQIRTMVAQGNQVAVIVDCKGTHTGELLGVPGSGNKVDFPAVHFFEVKDGKMYRDTIIWDRTALMEQLTGERSPTTTA